MTEQEDCSELAIARFYDNNAAYWQWWCACGEQPDTRFDTPLAAMDAARPHYRRKK